MKKRIISGVILAFILIPLLLVKDLFPIYKEKLNCDGLTLCQNNEYGQEVKHYHLHMIPRYENDGINFKTEIDKKDPKEIYEILK